MIIFNAYVWALLFCYWIYGLYDYKKKWFDYWYWGNFEFGCIVKVDSMLL